MQNSIHPPASRQPASEISPNERKRAPNSETALTGIQLLQSYKKIKTHSSALNAASLREVRAYTSEPYATGVQSARNSDILMGRGNQWKHLGNAQLRALITHGSPTFAPIDLQAHRELKKGGERQLSLAILQELHSTIPRRRFLQRREQKGLYDEVPDARAIAKIKQTIRDERNEATTNEVPSADNQSAHIPQYASIENQLDDEPPISYDEFAPIPLDLAASHESYIEEMGNNPSLHLLAAISDDNNDRKPAAAARPIEPQTSQPKPSPIRWTKAEDQVLTAEISRLNQLGLDQSLHWFHLSKLIPTHTSKSIRDRWANHLNPILDKTPFSEHELNQIKTGVERYGRHWVTISENIFGSKRSENMIKNNFYGIKFKRYIINNYGVQTYNQLMDKK